jgi:hypothetical protein
MLFFMYLYFLQNVHALATLPARASVEMVGEFRTAEKLRRNSGLVGVAQPRLVRLGFLRVTFIDHWMVKSSKAETE